MSMWLPSARSSSTISLLKFGRQAAVWRGVDSRALVAFNLAWHSLDSSSILSEWNSCAFQNYNELTTLPRTQLGVEQLQGMGIDQPSDLHPRRKPGRWKGSISFALEGPKIINSFYSPVFWVCCFCWRRDGGESLPEWYEGPSLPPAGGCFSWEWRRWRGSSWK